MALSAAAVAVQVTGMVVQYQGTKAALVEIGAKSSAYLPIRESTINELPDGATVDWAVRGG